MFRLQRWAWATKFTVICKVVCDRRCVTKLCVKDGVWQLCVTKCVAYCSSVAVFDNVSTSALHRSHEIHSHIQYAKLGVTMPQVPRLPRMSPSTTPATQNEGGCHQVPRLPRKRRWMSPSATSAASATPATPATQNEGGCHQVPRLPRKRRWMSPSATSAASATPATQNKGRCHQVPRLARKTKADVTKCHACHVKPRWLSPSVTKLCEWDGLRKMVGDKVACERWCVTKLCEWDGVWQSCVCEMVCERRWCVTKVSEADGTGSGIQNQKQEPHTKMWGKTKTKKRGEKNEKKTTQNRLAYLYSYGEGLLIFPGICVLNCEGFANGTPTLYNSFWNSHLLLG